MKHVLPKGDWTGRDGGESNGAGEGLLDFVEWAMPRPQSVDRILAFSAAYRVVQTDRLGAMGGVAN
ncbi:MAG: hypothetical protein RJA19_1658 [Bacteroidota bacterium]|jgi:hypothetical protein